MCVCALGVRITHHHTFSRVCVQVTLEHNNETVSEVKVKYFDTIPPCVSLCVLKTGFVFAASEFGNHALYQIQARHATPCALRTH